jgi:hypothetical protein
VSARASGAIPGLLRRCSPVILAIPGADGKPWATHGVVISVFRNAAGTMAPLVAYAEAPWWAKEPPIPDLDLTDPTGMDHGARFVAEEILDPSWGTVEGVICHMSWRGYLELHIWTTRLRGRPLSVNVGSRFSTLLPGTFEAFEQRNRTHGWGEFAIGTPSEPTDPAEALALAIAHVAGSGS